MLAYGLALASVALLSPSTTQFYVQGDPGNARDFLWRRLGEEGQAALTRPFVNGPDGMKAEYAVVVQA